MVENLGGLKTFMDGYLKVNLDTLKKTVKKKWDGVVLIDGMEGSGKSTLGITVGWYLSEGKLSLDNIVFTFEQFKERINNSKPFDVVIWDEFVMSGLSTEAMNKLQTELIKLLTTIRYKQLYIILIIPYIHILRKYFAIARSRFLIHTYTKDGISRGSFRFYSFKAKKTLYMKCKKDFNYDYKIAPCSFKGNFTDVAEKIINPDEYNKKKTESIISIGVKKTKPISDKEKYADLWKMRCVLLMEYLQAHKMFNYSQMSEITKMKIDKAIMSVNKFREGELTFNLPNNVIKQTTITVRPQKPTVKDEACITLVNGQLLR